MNAILYNARVYPQYPVRRRPTLVVISGNMIAAVGHDIAAARKEYPRHRLIDLKGRVIIPGLVDSHTHFYFWTVTLGNVHLDGLPNFDRVLEAIRTFASKGKRDEWLVGDGWSPSRWSEYHLPDARELDAVSAGRPAFLFSKDQHMAWVNTRAMELAGIDKHTPDPKGGCIDRDSEGNPTGILREIPGYFPVIKLISDPGIPRVEKLWATSKKIAYSRGVTGFHSFDGPQAHTFFEHMHSRNKLGFRVQYYFPVAMLDDLVERKITSGLGDRTFRVGGVKIFSDGSLGAQTALMKKPYRGTKDRYGIATTTLPELKRQVKKANANDLACAIHAIGDQAVANVISAFEHAGSNRQLRNRIEHLQIVSRSDIPRLKRIGAIASMQPSHCPSDRKLVAEFWGGRGRNAYIFRTLLEQDIPLAFGSDLPIEELTPLGGIHAAVNRNGFGEQGGRFYPEERLTVAAAVRGFTTGAAFAAGREEFSGKIAPGFQADLAILDDDIYTMPPAEIYRARVAGTIFDGKPVFGARRLGF